MSYLRSLGLCGLLLAGAAQAAPATSYFPDHDLGGFLATHLDLATIRSSLGPSRTPQLRTFADFKMVPTSATDELLEFDTPDWLYQLRIVERRDVNRDGIEDLVVCFSDMGRGGASYNDRQSLLITRYAAQGYAVALDYSVDACTQGPQRSSIRPPAEAGADAGRIVPDYERMGKFIYGFHRIVSPDELKRVALDSNAPPALAERAGKLAQHFDDILAARAQVPQPEIDATLREAMELGRAVQAWRISSGQQGDFRAAQSQADATNPSPKWYEVRGGAWSVPRDIVAEMTSTIGQAGGTALTTNPGRYTIQYQGVSKDAARSIRLMGACNIHGTNEKTLSERFLVVFDGGKCYFDATYDPQQKRFTSFAYHGHA